MLLSEEVPGRPELARAVECADMKMRLRRQSHGFARQCRSASAAKPPCGSSRRRIELGDVTLRDLIGRAFECGKDRNRRACMPAATLAVAPIYALWLTCRSKTHRAAEAPTFELVGRAAHDLILH